MEALSRMMSTMVDNGPIFGFSMESGNQEEMIVSHLLFANDMLIFCEPSGEQLSNLRCIVLCFEVVSGLKINLSKSEILLVGNVGDVEGLASILTCKVASLPTKYLGFPLGVPYKASTIWNGIIEKMEHRLAGWKRLYLSNGAKLTLYSF
jgi:hypothetical protein